MVVKDQPIFLLGREKSVVVNLGVISFCRGGDLTEAPALAALLTFSLNFASSIIWPAAQLLLGEKEHFSQQSFFTFYRFSLPTPIFVLISEAIECRTLNLLMLLISKRRYSPSFYLPSHPITLFFSGPPFSIFFLKIIKKSHTQTIHTVHPISSGAQVIEGQQTTVNIKRGKSLLPGRW